MKEVDDLVHSISESFKAFTKLIDKVNEKLETVYGEKEQPASAPIESQAVVEEKAPEKAVDKKPSLKIATKLKAASKPRKTAKPKGGINEKVQKVIEKNPGIDFKSLLKKTGFEAKQVQNALPQLKKAGKVKSEGRGIYYPVSFVAKETPATEAQEPQTEETVE